MSLSRRQVVAAIPPPRSQPACAKVRRSPRTAARSCTFWFGQANSDGQAELRTIWSKRSKIEGQISAAARGEGSPVNNLLRSRLGG